MAPQKGSKRVVKDRPALTSMGFQRVQDRREMAEYRARRAAADPVQEEINAIVNEAYEAWLDAGKPTDWNDQPGTFWTGPLAEAETLLWRVRKAGAFYTLKIRFGQIKEVTHEDGEKYAEVVFTVSDRDPKESDPEQEAADDEARQEADFVGVEA